MRTRLKQRKKTRVVRSCILVDPGSLSSIMVLGTEERREREKEVCLYTRFRSPSDSRAREFTKDEHASEWPDDTLMLQPSHAHGNLEFLRTGYTRDTFVA